MAKIKVLRIIARLNIGGPAIHTVLLTEGLDRKKFESLLVCGAIGKGEGDMAYYAAEKNISPVYIPQLRREINPANDLIAFLKILRIIVKENPDIIHTHTAKAGTLGRLAGIVYNYMPHIRKVKLVHTFHGHIFEGYFNSFLTRMFIFIEKILALYTCRIITVSREVKKELVSLKIAKVGRIAVIPLGFELERFFEIPKRRAGKILNIGIVGRLAPVKNHRLFLEAARDCIALNNRNDNSLNFKIIGDGELRRDLERYARDLNISEYVEFRGWQKDLTKVYSELDIVCLTSFNEGTPVSLIEAMASGRAVVATGAGGVIDLLGEGRGIIVESENAREFSSAVYSLIVSAGLMEGMAIAGREFTRKEFTKDRLINDIDELYSNILKAEGL